MRATSSTFAPTCSQRLATSLMNAIFVARNELVTYLIISAVSGVVTIMGLLECTNTWYSSRSSRSARAEPTPSTMRSGFKKSDTDLPSRKNSGLDATSNGCDTPRAAMRSRMIRPTSREVPTGTVDLSTTSRYPSIQSPMAAAVSNT